MALEQLMMNQNNTHGGLIEAMLGPIMLAGELIIKYLIITLHIK